MRLSRNTVINCGIQRETRLTNPHAERLLRRQENHKTTLSASFFPTFFRLFREQRRTFFRFFGASERFFSVFRLVEAGFHRFPSLPQRFSNGLVSYFVSVGRRMRIGQARSRSETSGGIGRDRRGRARGKRSGCRRTRQSEFHRRRGWDTNALDLEG